MQKVTKKFLDQEKMRHNIEIQANYFFKKQAVGETKTRNISTICKDGEKNLETYFESSNRVWIIEDYNYCGLFYLEELSKIAQLQNQDYNISFSPLFPDMPNAIFFPKYKVCFVLGKRDYASELEGKEYHYINMKRFVDLKAISQRKQKIKFSSKCCTELMSSAVESLFDAARIHAELEKFYIQAMNFDQVRQIEREILLQIFNSPL